MPSSERQSDEVDGAPPAAKELKRMERYLWLACIVVLLIGLLIVNLGS